MVETADSMFSQRLNQELDRVGVPSKARPKRLAGLTGKTIPGARKWLVSNSVPRGNDLNIICDEFGLDVSYVRLGIRNKANEEPYEEVNVLLQSVVFVRVYEVAKRNGIDIHNQHEISEKSLEKAYKVLMKIAAKHPTEEIDEDLIMMLIK